MKCEKCGQEMIKGLLTGDSQHWVSVNSFMGKLNQTLNLGVEIVFAWKCENCKRIDLKFD